jgi:hypothetical protein
MAMQVRRAGVATLLAVVATVLIATQSVAAAGWSRAETIFASSGCFQSVATIRPDGVPEAAATCDDDIYQFEQRAEGWTVTKLTSAGSNFGVQIAVDGGTLFVAYSRETAPDACAEVSARAGVFVRSRSLPDGAWSAARRIGAKTDRLQAFRMADGHVHAAVTPGDGGLIYETDASGTLRRYPLPAANGLASLAVRKDGRARIAYEAVNGLRFATFSGHGFHWQQIPGTTARDGLPQLVLDADDHAHLLWTHDDRSKSDSSCDFEDHRTARDGTSYATERNGAWTPASPSARRFTASPGGLSLTFDPATGRVHALVDAVSGLHLWTRSKGGTWSSVVLSTAASFGATVLLDRASGRLTVVYLTTAGLFARTN